MKRLMLSLAALLMAVAAARAGGPEEGSAFITKAYNVEDLVLTPKQRAAVQARGPIDLRNGVTADPTANFEPLVDLMTTSVAPGTWKAAKDGVLPANSMTPFLLNYSLIIRGPVDVHEQVARKLRQIRQLPALSGTE